MKLSVCVSTYNQEKYIRDCLASIDMQEIGIPFEIIVGVDKSSDKTIDIVSDFAKTAKNSIKIITSDTQVGASNNYLRIHQIANSEYVCHIDGDDLMLPGKLQKQVFILDNNSHLSAVWHDMVLFSDSGEILNPNYASVWDGEITLSDFLRVGFVSAHSSIMYRRKCRSHYNYDYPVPDYAIFLDLLAHGNGYVIRQSLGKYRHNVDAGVISTGFKTFKSNLYRALHEFSLTKNKDNYSKKDIFCFSFLNLLSDIKSRRGVDKTLILLLAKNISIVSPLVLIDSYKKMMLASVKKKV
ncbi:glycosyltransferase family 2 protein [Citrobacter freundii]|uniref:glycosyltransferase family 2 protein n=1 Tax=Citrobacter freundii TaxID=546 RepID=UPI000BCB5400|nr:glycosyltransferase [Citrobacter freundii]EJM7587484.1 glycosyltransferase [Citrobacter freundii]EKW0741059.1 glycosyltransferase [Citrobacter freundii]ELP5233179.1 glycosyltransferase [Citrobacter freundii]MBJ9037551.1 glycosyltransferase [Citrobacter freundii]MCH9321541.1 glycosyltransferase [Citrobacter freundii]